MNDPFPRTWLTYDAISGKVYAQTATSAAELGEASDITQAAVRAEEDNATVAAGQTIGADTSGGSFTLTLPAQGGILTVFDPTGDWEAHPLTIAGNGATIDGAATFSANAAGYALTFYRAAADAAWRYTIHYSFGG